MASLKASPAQLHRIVRARIERGWAIDRVEWLIAASNILEPNRDWDNAEKYAVSIGSWKRFLKGEPIRPQAYKAFCQVLRLDWQSTIAIAPQPNVNFSNKCDWGEAPDTPMFLSRDAELATLREWIITDRVRTLSILGMGGVGKTALVAKLAQQIAGEFNYVMWRSLRETPPVEKIVADWIKLISHHHSIDLPTPLGEKITILLDLLRLSRCLLVLDNAESILQSGVLSGNYQPRFNGYKELLRRIGAAAHQSCLIITSREQFQELRQLQGDFSPVRAMQLTGLQQAAAKILTAKGVFGSQQEVEDLIAHYHGNPLALTIVADTIRSTCNNSIDRYLQGSTIFGGIEQLLTAQFDRLAPAEQSVMYWLAIHREPVTAEVLAADIGGASLKTIIAALDSLLCRSLIQANEDGFTLQNVVMEYTSECLIAEIDRELTTDRFELFRTHAIVQATAKDYIRATQQRLLLTPILDRLTKYQPIAAIEQKFRSLINYFRQEQLCQTANSRIGYAIGNIINLLLALDIDLAGYDFSDLPICQAYLSGIELRSVNFARAYLEKTVFSQSLGSIFTVAFSPDCQLLATGGMDGQIRLWQVADGRQIAAWQAHGDWIRNVTFSPDGKLLASSSNDTTIKVWDWENVKCLYILRGHTDWVWTSKFVTWKGLIFLISASSDRTGKIWNLNLGKCVFTFHEPEDLIWSVAFSNNGYTLAASSAKSVKLWNIWTKKCVKIFEENAERVRALAFSPNGKMLVGGDDRLLKIWDVASGCCLNTVELAANTSIWSLMFSPDGRQLITAGTDKIQIWDAENWEPTTTLAEPEYRIHAIAYSADHQMMAVGSDDQLVRIWDTNTSQPLHTLTGGSNRIWTIAVSPQSASGLVYLASGSDDRKLRIWNAKTGELLHTKSGHQGRIRSLAFSPSGKLLASASHDRTLKLWDVATGNCLKTWYGHTDWVWGVAFCRDERTLISTADDRTILVWDTHTNESRLVSNIDTEWIWAIATHPHLPLIAVTGNSQNIELWHLNDRTLDFTLLGHEQRIRSIVFNPAGDKLASSSDDLQIKLWDLDSPETRLQKRLQCLRTLIGHTREIRALTFIPPSATNPELLVSASDDLTLRVWNPHTGDCVGVLHGHKRGIWSVCYSPELGILYSCSEDETIKLWELETFTCIQTLTLPKPYRGMNITGASGLSSATQTTLMALGAISSTIT